VQELRRALHVGEEEGDGSGREIFSHAAGSCAQRKQASNRRGYLETIAGCTSILLLLAALVS